jgi:hypothetical protein
MPAIQERGCDEGSIDNVGLGQHDRHHYTDPPCDCDANPPRRVQLDRKE